MRQWPLLQRVLRVIAPFLLGTLEEDLARMFRMFSDKASFSQRFLHSLASPSGGANVADFNTVAARRTISPSSNGVGNARTIAQILAALAGDGSVDGVRLLSADGLRAAVRVDEAEAVKLDACFGKATELSESGLGKNVFGLPPIGDWFGWGGWGGSVAQFVPGKGAVFAYAMTGMGSGLIGDERTRRIGAALAEAVAQASRERR
jgi:CubicO group peptidase (beta-lactamase class C family)